MHLARFTDLALRAIVLLGARQDGPRLTVDDVAKAVHAPRHHVAKAVHRLGQLGVLETVRGRAGGLALAAGAASTTVGWLVRELEGTGELVDCEQPPCPFRGDCRLRRALRTAQHAFLAALDEVTIADLIAGTSVPLPLAPPPPR
ncbi:RrF2 family transcriptional regulator [Streptoalloteichus hindustanus]|uniref:Transcriptional regulator, BadM/Rrf2 family n=1 Tax=Streptoalloteichus hindustanus TaxID=2017 RepID=A0A1M4WDQ2_STRHI|nr:Rrf2 family transcriptional regulator [Streptoalloteichus hindustanus]SHE79344.1 transcriptional regulator, BadM/Rrf2 family [Streptoalloteichus hindustanus]